MIIDEEIKLSDKIYNTGLRKINLDGSESILMATAEEWICIILYKTKRILDEIEKKDISEMEKLKTELRKKRRLNLPRKKRIINENKIEALQRDLDFYKGDNIPKIKKEILIQSYEQIRDILRDDFEYQKSQGIKLAKHETKYKVFAETIILHNLEYDVKNNKRNKSVKDNYFLLT
jgi:hypothetical protein